MDIVSTYQPITLDQMSGIKLMNRIDTKFVTTRQRLLQLLELCKTDYMAQETGGLRVIPYATAYFDTPDFNMYVTHHNGHAGRQKLRIRSYVASQLSFLEVKTKDNHKRTRKKRVAVDVTMLDEACAGKVAFTPQGPFDEFLHKHLQYAPQSMLPALQNSFNRITLVNRAKTERLTIDIDLKFHNLMQLRIMPMGFSKYCMGSALTNPDLKTNRFKERLRLIDRMQHTS